MACFCASNEIFLRPTVAASHIATHVQVHYVSKCSNVYPKMDQLKR